MAAASAAFSTLVLDEPAAAEATGAPGLRPAPQPADPTKFPPGTAVAREDAAQLLQLISRDSELDDDSDEDGGGDARMADVAAGGATPAATAGCVAEFSEDFSAAAAAGK